MRKQHDDTFARYRLAAQEAEARLRAENERLTKERDLQKKLADGFSVAMMTAESALSEAVAALRDLLQPTDMGAAIRARAVLDKLGVRDG